ncbi:MULTISPECIES: nuclear transport factor 2 family protein [unclassified Mycobacterium]|uniref:nuclear transport factor 2 family protein n=1 Tax=unclassified Mycobacterium TaxID=2642494 RepID=UPI0029C77119|nr:MULTISPECIES: nuclear transport factor 2 family protein [unclassified Mycobacterium]
MAVTGRTDKDALLDLSYAYASAIDRRNRDAFLAVFHPDATVRSYPPGQSENPTMERTGHDELAVIVDRIIPRMCTNSFHLVANAQFVVEGDAASGEVYGVAHHLTAGGEHHGTDYVWFMRYQDRYTRVDGEWRIKHRDALTDWTETRFVDPTTSSPSPAS